MPSAELPSTPSSGRDRTIGRRRLLGGALAGAGSMAVLAACSATPARSSRASGTGPGATATADPLDLPGGASALGAGSFQLFSDPDLNFQALFALGGAGVNAEVGEVITAVDQANAAQGGATYQSFYDAFVAMGNALDEKAAASAKAGHLVSARAQFLRAAQYYNQALFFVLGTSTPQAEEQVYTTMNTAFTESAKLTDPAWEPVEIPYQGSTLPGYFLKATNASGRRPTVIVNNGSDAQLADLWAYGGYAAIERGWNALIFEGPGQGANLFVKQMPFVPDWNTVITPIVDLLVGRPDVDPAKIALTGWSFGGALVARAVAVEKRLAAVVSDPGFVSAFQSYPTFLQDLAKGTDQQQVNEAWANTVVSGATPEQHFLLQKRLEIYTKDALLEARQGKIPSDWYTISRAIEAFDVDDVVKDISTTYLVTQYEGDASFPGAGQTFFDALPGKNKTFVNFTIAEGAQYHDAPMAPQYRNEVVFDWLDETVGA